MTPRHKNIIGTEMEWAIMGRLEGDNGKLLPLNGEIGMPSAGPLVTQENLPDEVSTVGRSYFLSNGARYYPDVGGHVEYATPENISLDDMVLSEIAGERLVAESLRRFIAAHDNLAEVVLCKRVIDDVNETWGYHVNISEDRAPFFASDKRIFSNSLGEKMQPLALHYATSLPLLGGGVVQTLSSDGGQYRYSLGQKVIKIDADVRSSTTRDKPFINSRDEPHADDTKYMRLHIVGTDPHISPWATRMMLGTSTLLLAGIVQGKVRELTKINPSVESPGAYVAHRAKYDIEGKRQYEFLVGGKTKSYTAADIQEMYITDLEKVTDKTQDEEWVFEEWKRAVQDQKHDVMRLQDRSDAIAKLSLIQQRNIRHGKGQDTIDAAALELDKLYTTVFHATKEKAQNHDTATLIAATLAEKLRRGRLAAGMPTEEAIQDRVKHAPTSTRADKRGQLVRRIASGSENISLGVMNWGEVTVTDRGIAKKIVWSPWNDNTDAVAE